MSALVLVCGNVFDGVSDALTGPGEILVEGNRIRKVGRSVGRPSGAEVDVVMKDGVVFRPANRGDRRT